jgi:hypothetical protein
MLLRVFNHNEEVFFLLAMCILNVFGHLIRAEARYNWYVHDINIFSYPTVAF